MPLATAFLLQMLLELDISYNKLQGLPASLSKLQHLTCLRASYNQLTAVGPEVRGNKGRDWGRHG